MSHKNIHQSLRYDPITDEAIDFNQVIASKLRDLEIANQRLREEKHSLQKQLDHVLNRLACGRLSECSPAQAAESLKNLEQIIKRTIRISTLSEKYPHIPNILAPLATMDVNGLSDSISFTNGLALQDYSSLSDTYEEYCLAQKDFTDSVRLSGLSAGNGNVRSSELILPEEMIFGSHHYVFHRSRKDSFGDEEGMTMTPSDIMRFSERKVSSDLRKDDAMVMSAATVVDSVASSSHKVSHETTPYSEMSAQFLAKRSSKNSISTTSSSSVTTDEEMELDRNKVREGSMEIISSGSPLKIIQRTSSSLPGFLQLISASSKTNEKIPYEVEKISKESTLTTEKGEWSGVRKAPPSVQITRKLLGRLRISGPILSSTSSASSIIDLDAPKNIRVIHTSSPLKQKSDRNISTVKPSIPCYPSTPLSMYRKERRTPEEEFVHQLYKHIYMTQPTIKIGNDSNFLNNFQKFPCYFSSELADFQSLDFLMNEPGFANLLRFYETYTIVSGVPCLVQRTPVTRKLIIDFKKDLQVIVSQDQTKRDELSGQNTILLVESSPDAQSSFEMNGFNQGISKEVVSQASLEYFFPPNDDDNNINGQTIFGVKLRHDFATNGTPNNELVQYSGYLSKLGNKFKIWHRYWCKLSSVSILFHESEDSITPKKSIELSQVRTIFRPHSKLSSGSNTELRETVRKPPTIRSDREYRKVSSSVPAQRRIIQFPITESPISLKLASYKLNTTKTKFFEVLLKNGKLYTFRSDSLLETERWLIELRRALKRAQAENLLEENVAQFLMEGWLKRIKSGQSKRVWCRLFGSYLIYYRSSSDKVPTGYRSLIGTKLKFPGEVGENLSQQSPIQIALEKFKEADSELDFGLFDYYNNSDSDSDTGQNIESEKCRTFSLWTPHRDPVYLIPPTDSDFEKWRIQLTRACSDIPYNTADKQITSLSTKMSSAWVFCWSRLVRPIHSQSYFHTRQLPSEPLSRSTDIRARNLWRGVFECLLAISYPSRQIVEKLGNRSDFPTCQYTPRDQRYQSARVSQKYSLLHTIVMTCFSNPELKDELYLQLMKQCMPPLNYLKSTPSCSAPDSGKIRRRKLNTLLCSKSSRDDDGFGARIYPDSRDASPDESASFRNDFWTPIIAMWECLCLVITIFLPSPMVSDCLEYYLQKFPVPESIRTHTMTGSPTPDRITIHDHTWAEESLAVELGKYAAFCRDMLEKTKREVGRSMPPSGLEVTAISIRNPYTHAQPFSLPFHLPNPGTYEVISFDGTTKIRYITHRLTQKLNLFQACSLGLCKLGLYVRIPRFDYIIYLEDSINVCDVISCYEQLTPKIPYLGQESSMELCLRIQAFSPQLFHHTDKTISTPALKFLVNQFQEDVKNGLYCAPFRGVDLMELLGHAMRIDFGDAVNYNTKIETPLFSCLESYLPANWLQSNLEGVSSQQELSHLIMQYWKKISDNLNESVVDHEKVAFAGVSYLSYLRRISPHRFCPRVFAARLINNEEIDSKKVIWVAPFSDKIQFLTIHRANKDNPKNTLSTVRSLKTIPMESLVSFGVQNPILFFMVFKIWDYEKQTRSKQIKPSRLLKKIYIVLCDPYSAIELCSTIAFYVRALNISVEDRSNVHLRQTKNP